MRRFVLTLLIASVVMMASASDAKAGCLLSSLFGGRGCSSSSASGGCGLGLFRGSSCSPQVSAPSYRVEAAPAGYRVEYVPVYIPVTDPDLKQVAAKVAAPTPPKISTTPTTVSVPEVQVCPGGNCPNGALQVEGRRGFFSRLFGR